MDKNNCRYLTCIFLTLYFILFFVLNQYLFDYTLYCDSSISSNDVLEVFNCDKKSQVKVYYNTDINCFTAFTRYKNIARRKILWYACYNGKENFNSYESFKEH
jgi:hypothetical protein